MPKSPLLRIAVVDDHEIVRNAFAEQCDAWPHGQVVLRATDGIDYEEQVATMPPVDIAVVDLRMPRRDGFETIAWICMHQPKVLTLAISFEPEDDMVHHALQAGAKAVVGKVITAKELHAALEALRTTGHYANELMMRQLTHTPNINCKLALRKKLNDTLSPREMEFLLKYIHDNSPSRNAIADEMEISVHTAETHRRNIVEKTAAHTRVAMVKMAIRFGLISV